MTFLPDQTITAGKITLVVEKFKKALITQDLDLCTDVGLTCPLQAKMTATASITQEIPGDVPAIKAVAHIEVMDGSGSQLSCIEVPIQVVKAEDGSSHLIAATTTSSKFSAEEDKEEEKGTDEEWKKEGDASVVDKALRGSSGLSSTATI